MSEKHWSEDNFEESTLVHNAGLNKLGIAISIGKFIVANESKGPVQDSFIQKIKELMIRRD